MEPIEYNSMLETNSDFVVIEKSPKYGRKCEETSSDLHPGRVIGGYKLQQGSDERNRPDPLSEGHDTVRTNAEILLNATERMESNRKNGSRKEKLEDILEKERTISIKRELWREESKKSAIAFLCDEDDDYDIENNNDDINHNDQLPHIEEARSMAGTTSRQPSRRKQMLDNLLSMIFHHPPQPCICTKRGIHLILSTALILSLIVGLAVGIVKIQHLNKNDIVIDEDMSIDVSEIDRIKTVFTYLAKFSPQEDLIMGSNGTSPQLRAALWMAHEDILQYPVPTTTSTATNESSASYQNFLQRYALAVLYYALHGDQWTRSLNFLTDEHECSWYEDVPSKNGTLHYAIGVSCNDQLKVDGILIPNNNLSGSLPHELGLLEDLKFFVAPKNSISGVIPIDLLSSNRNMNDIEDINLKENSLNGSLPIDLGNAMERLKILELSNNRISGAIPESLRNLTSLQVLALDNNELTGDIIDDSVLNKIQNLEYLNLENNLLSGTIDDTFLYDLTNLIEVDISDNGDLDGTIPLHLLNHKTLQLLDLGNNNLSGKLPRPIPNNNERVSPLRYLSLQNNSISGTIPDTMHVFSLLTYLDLSHNYLSGQIEESYTLENMTQIKYLFLNDNNFKSGNKIPDVIESFINIRQLSLGNTNRIDPIPDWMFKSSIFGTELNLLDLRDNSLEEVNADIFLGGDICNTLPSLSTMVLRSCGNKHNNGYCDCCLCCDVEICTDDLVFEKKFKKTISTKSFSPDI